MTLNYKKPGNIRLEISICEKNSLLLRFIRADPTVRTDIAYPSVFAMRALCAILIVLAHSTLPYKEYVTPLIRIAVPLFFMMSGYFIWSPSRAGMHDKLIRKLKQIGWIILYANGVYVLFGIVLHLFHPETELPLSTLKSWVLLIFFGTGVTIPFWYLTAYFQTMLTFLVALRLRREYQLIHYAPLVILIPAAIGMYGFLFGIGNALPYSLKVNFLMDGIPAFFTGYLIQEYLPQITEKITLRRSSWLLAGMIGLAFIEMLLLHRFAPGADQDYSNTIYLTTLPLAASVFLWCLLRPDVGKGSYLETIGRRYTMDIYLWHFLFFLLLFTCWRTPFVEKYSFLIILPCSLLLAIILRAIRRLFAK